jgi:serine/threonine protein kinase
MLECGTSTSSDGGGGEDDNLGVCAPELVDPFQGHRIDEKVDVWALGIVAFALIFQTFPFAETTLAILNTSLDDVIAREAAKRGSSSVPEALVVMLRRCLVKNPAERWSIFDVMEYLQQPDVKNLSPKCSTFTFECAVKPVDSFPQPVYRGAAGGEPVVQDSSHIKADLFSHLVWQPSSVDENRAACAAADVQLFAEQPGQPKQNVLDDLFSWQPVAPQNPPQPPAGANLDAFF